MWQKLFDETTFHGLWHATRPDGFWSRVVWVIVNFGLLFMLLISLASLFLEYKNNDKVANFDLKRPINQGFPDVVVCPNLWVDVESAVNKYVSADLLQYTVGFVGVLAHETDLRPYDQGDSYFDFNKISELKTQFREAMKNHTSLSAFLKNLSMNIDDIIAVSGCNGCIYPLRPKKIAKSSQVCYHIDADPLDTASKLVFSLYPKIGDSENIAQILVGDLALFEHQLNFLMVERSFSYDITLQPHRYRQCDTDEGHIPLTCEQQCLVKRQKAAGKNIHYFMGEPLDEPGRYYIHSSDISWFADSRIDLLNASNCRNASCDKELCDFTYYHFTVITYPAKDGKLPTVTIRMNSHARTVSFKSHGKNSIAGLLGNVGGLLGLFLGASISSFLHLLFFVCCFKCNCPWMFNKVSSSKTEGRLPFASTNGGVPVPTSPTPEPLETGNPLSAQLQNEMT